jgi:hypothetical protein
MLPPRIESFLNAGEVVAAEVPSEQPGTRTFVRIRPLPKPGVPREERRYLNSSWSMWEYWDFEFRRFTLRHGWNDDQWNYDRYIVADQRHIAVDSASFQHLLVSLIPNSVALQHATESECPE